MKYRSGEFYHIFNQGNNKQNIFLKSINYDYFLKKTIIHLRPCADILAYCLMPNHFHFLVRINDFGTEYSTKINPGHIKQEIIESKNLQQRISVGLAILLRSYTRGINKQENRSGALFRTKTKIKNDDIQELRFVQNSAPKFSSPIHEYVLTCFEYIHENPVKASLVLKKEDWYYSSIHEYINKPLNTICNMEIAKNLNYVCQTKRKQLFTYFISLNHLDMKVNSLSE